MNKQALAYGVVRLVALCLVFIAGEVFASQPGSVLDRYFKHVQETLQNLADKKAPSRELLRTRSELVNGAGYWQPVRGRPGQAMGVVSFFQRKTPLGWDIKEVTMAGDLAVVKAHFDVPTFPDYPWRSESTLVKVGGQWLISSFSDLTRRPIAPGATIESVLEHYFRAARSAAESLYTGQLSKEEEQSVVVDFSFGAGYWVGQSGNRELPAGTLFSFFISQRPDSWEIESARIAGDYAEAVVHFRSKPRYGDEVTKSYTIEMSGLNGEWFLAGHRSSKSEPKEVKSTNIEAARPVGDNPVDMVSQQLEILKHPDARMENLFKASEPLWIDARQARRGLGRLIGMAMGMSGGLDNRPAWEIVGVDTELDRSEVTARAIWPDSYKAKLFSRVRFSLRSTENGWRLSDAQLLRD